MLFNVSLEAMLMTNSLALSDDKITPAPFMIVVDVILPLLGIVCSSFQNIWKAIFTLITCGLLSSSLLLPSRCFSAIVPSGLYEVLFDSSNPEGI